MSWLYYIVLAKKVNAKVPFVVPENFIRKLPDLQMFVSYLSSPKNDQQKELLDDCVKNNKPPPDNFTWFKCEVKGIARSYDEAMKDLQTYISQPQNKRRINIKTFRAAHCNSTAEVDDLLHNIPPLPVSQGSSKNSSSSQDNHLRCTSNNDNQPVTTAETLHVGVEGNNRTNNRTPPLDNRTLVSTSNKDYHSLSNTDSDYQGITDTVSLQMASSSGLLPSTNIEKSSSPQSLRSPIAVNVDDTNSCVEKISEIIDPLLVSIEEQQHLIENTENIENKNGDSDHSFATESNKSFATNDENCTPTKRARLDDSDEIYIKKSEFDAFRKEITKILSSLSNNSKESKGDISKVNRNVTNLSKDVKELKNSVSELSTAIKNQPLQNVHNFYSIDDFARDSHYNFPLSNEDQFDHFNNDLATNNRDIRTKLKQYLSCAVNVDIELVITIRHLFKERFFQKDVLINYVAQKATENKKAFKDTHFYKVLEASIIETFRSAVEKVEKDFAERRIDEKAHEALLSKYKKDLQIPKGIAIVLSTVKDWSGGRKQRMKNADHLKNEQ